MRLSFAKMTPVWLLGIAFILIFSGLLAVRMGFFSSLFSGTPVLNPPAEKLPGTETWKNLFLQDKKIGYSHSALFPEPKGYRVEETLFMRMNIMGFSQDLQMATQAHLKPDLSLSSFDFTLHSGIFEFRATGKMKTENSLSIETSLPGELQKKEIRLDYPLHITAGLMYSAAQELRTSESGRLMFHIFDPLTMTQEPVTVEAVGREDIRIGKEKISTTRLTISYRGIAQTAWMDENGEIVKEKGILGMTFEKTTRQEALAGIAPNPESDLTRLAAVPVNTPIESPRETSRLKIRIEGISDENLNLDGGRQALSENILTITQETLQTEPFPDVSTIPKMKKFLAPEPFIESNDPAIQKLATTTVSAGDTPLTKAKKLVEWVFQNIKKQPALSLPDAVATLENRMGDCNEHAVLLAALARAAGIPSKIEAGLVYLDGRFYYHAWNLLYIGQWITADAVFGQMPADATHIRFASGGLNAQIDLIAVIGRVKIKILETGASGQIKGPS
jgi:hypothetical protein